MNKIAKSQLLAVALLALGTSLSAPAGAAKTVTPRTPVFTKTPILACCHCLGENASLNLNTGATQWLVTPPQGAQSVAVPAANSAWTSLSPAIWIGPPGAPQTIGNYTYVTSFIVPDCTIPSKVILSGKFAADNNAKLYIDSNAPISQVGTLNYGFLPGSVTPYSVALGAGTHTIKIVVTNTDSVTGLSVLASVTRNCASDPYAHPSPRPMPSPINPTGKHRKGDGTN